MKLPAISQSSSKRGFTLVELLVVIVIIVTLMAVLVPTVNGVRRKAEKVQAKNAVASLVTAVDGYYATYSILPANTRSAPSQDDEVKTTDPIMSVLAGIDVDGMNKKKVVFFRGEQAKGSSKATAYKGLRLDVNNAELYDVWKKRGVNRGYIMLLDYDYDERLDDPFKPGKLIPRRVIAWSSGKDGEWNGSGPKRGVNKDNVYSWFD